MLNPSNLLDVRMDIKEDGHYNTKVNWKKTKLAIHWWLKVPRRYKRNSIKRDLHQSSKSHRFSRRSYISSKEICQSRLSHKIYKHGNQFVMKLRVQKIVT